MRPCVCLHGEGTYYTKISAACARGCLKNFFGEVGSVPVAWRGEGSWRPTGAREHVCGPGVILTPSAKGAREGARVKIMPAGCLQTAGRASRSA